MTEQQREAGRQELFSLMRQEHGVTCMESELTDIEQCVLSCALSHAEGEAVATIRDERATVDRLNVDDLRRICMLPAGTKLYTHPAPQVAGLTEAAIKSSPAYRALHREKENLLGLLKDQAPQVAVPDGWEMVPKRATKEMAEAAAERRGCVVSANLYATINAANSAAPTAPAGEPDDSDICEQVELPHVLAWADGIRGDMWAEYADRITDEEARVAQAVWAAHTGEQPVSDPDGLPGGLTFNALRAANAERIGSSKYRRCEEAWTPAHWMQATVGELGELANLLKKVDRGDFGLDEVLPDVRRELADVQTYLDILALKLGVDLGAATIDKFNEVSERIGSHVRLAPAPDEREIAELREDAERYRFWREVLAGDEKAAMDLFEEELNRDVVIGNRPPTGEELDKAVDVARRLRAGKEGE